MPLALNPRSRPWLLFYICSLDVFNLQSRHVTGIPARGARAIATMTSSDNNDPDDFFNNVSKLGNNVASLANHVVSYANSHVSEINDQAKAKSFKWLQDLDKDEEFTQEVEEFKKNLKSMAEEFKPQLNQHVKEYFSRPYQTRTVADIKPENRADEGSWFGQTLGHSLDDFGFWPGNFSPFGSYSKTPSAREYNACVSKQGQSVWDSKGYWRCLFPNKEIADRYLTWKQSQLPGKVLTKEDFDAADNKSKEPGVYDLGDKGTYFTNYDVFLNWRNTMYENIKREKRERRERFKQLYKAKESSAEAPGNVVALSIETRYTTQNDEVVMNEVRTETFADGTTRTTNVTKTKPVGATEWKQVESSNSNEGKGWFWNKD